MVNSPRAWLARLSLCNSNSAILCSQDPDLSFDSNAPSLAPKLRYLMESISREKSSSASALPDISSHNLGATSSCTRLSVTMPRPYSLRAPNRRVKSFINRQSSPIPRIELCQSASTEPRTATAAADAATIDELFLAPTAPPITAPHIPVIASSDLTPSSLALVNESLSPEALGLFFPCTAGQPRFNETSVMAALESSTRGRPQLLKAVKSHGSAEHQSLSSTLLNLDDSSLLTATGAHGEAEMAFLFGLTQKTEVRVMLCFPRRGLNQKEAFAVLPACLASYLPPDLLSCA